MPAAVNISRLATDNWEEALITGGGKQGALVYGSPRALRVTLSHERLFLPVDEPLLPPDTGTVLPHLRKLCRQGRFQQVADEIVALAVAEDPRYATLRNSDPFIGAATLTLVPHTRAGEPAEWQRGVDHDTAVVSQSWMDVLGDARKQTAQETFVSRADDVVVVRVRADAGLHGVLHLGPIVGAPPVPIVFERSAGPQYLSLTARFPRHWPGSIPGYVVACRMLASGGEICPSATGTSVALVNVPELLLLVRTVVADPDGGPDPVAARAALSQLPADYDLLLARHVAIHRELVDRCRLDLRGDPADRARPNEELLAAPVGPALVERLFDAARYAVICATGELPPNLQGVWSGTFDPAWRADYTLDGNLQAAVAGLGPTGTPELMIAVFDLLDAYRDDFRLNATRLYRAGGILLPSHLSTHGRLHHFGPRWCHTTWTAGAAWMARLYVDYWRYTGDRAFLTERALPFLREAVRFYSDFVEESGDEVCFIPSYSPENSPAGEEGPQACVNATMDVACVGDLLRNLLTVMQELGLDDPEMPRWRALLARLPRYRVGEDGALAEWLWPGLPNNHAHRHASHLYGLWYEPDPALLEPPLREAAVGAVRRRLAWWREHGDEMAFGLVQLGLAAAALGLAEEAYEIVCRLSSRYWRASMVSTHNAGSIFNIDICGGYPALIVAMLVRCIGHHIDLLPALPKAWPSGEIRGVLLRDGVRIDQLSWSPECVDVTLVADRDRELTLAAPYGQPKSATARAGEPIQLTFGRTGR